VSKKNKKSNVPIDENIQEEEVAYSAAITYRRGIPKYPVDFPEKTSMDVIARYLDDELYSHITKFETDRTKVMDARLDPSPWEIELAYLRREANIRRVRRDLHENFLRDNAQVVAGEEFLFDDDVDVEFISVAP
jgi:hypothetical protein